MNRTHTHFGFIQETRVKSLPSAFFQAFPKNLFRTIVNHANRGAAIIINNSLLPSDKFEVTVDQSQSTSHILQNLTVADADDNELKMSHVYQSPNLPLAPTLFSKIMDFSPNVVLGDINETAHKSTIQTWHNRETTPYTCNLIDFPTFQNHTTKKLTTKPDCIYAIPEYLPNLQIHDSGVVYGDHVRIDLAIASPLVGLPGPPPIFKKVIYHDFESVANTSSSLWEELPDEAVLGNVRHTLTKITKNAKRTKSVKNAYHFETLESKGTPKTANQAINAHFEKFTASVNASRELGKTWTFIKNHEKNTKSSPPHVKIARNRSRKSFKEIRKKCSRDTPAVYRTLPQKDRFLKAKRLIREYYSYANSLPFAEKAFTLAQLKVVLSDLNKSSSAGPDSTTWSAYPAAESSAWKKILFAINHQLFVKSAYKLPHWLKQARLVLVPKNDASGKLRPISIVNVLAVIIDKLHQARMDVLISQDPALKDRFGFIHNRSCEDVVGLLLSEVEKDKLINYKCALLQLDLSAAYDLVSFIDIVIAMDEFLKRNDQHLKNPHLLLFSYFWATNRTIIFEGTKFTPKNGLPQGAPLSCSIFVIILSFNPKPPASALLRIHAYYFADDASFYVSGPDLEAVKATVLEIVRDFENWCTEHSMVLNYEKSKILWFMPTDPELDIAIENAPWVRVLGVYFDKKLNFEHHVDTLIEYVKKYQRPLRYLMYLGLSDRLARQFVMGCRNKLFYGLYWISKIPETRRECLEKWWCNLLRSWLRAKNTVHRHLLFKASGLPNIENFSNYLLLKRAYFWGTKGLPDRPTASIAQILTRTGPARTNTRVQTRQSTQTRTSDSDFRYYCRESNTANARLATILQLNPGLAARLTCTQDPKWPDALVRTTLGADTVHIDKIWSKDSRAQKFLENDSI